MAQPKNKKSYARTHTRKAQNMKLDVRSEAACSKCGAPRLPHRVCPSCGWYKDRQVLEFKAEKE